MLEDNLSRGRVLQRNNGNGIEMDRGINVKTLNSDPICVYRSNRVRQWVCHYLGVKKQSGEFKR